jgi:hypothetical protein
MEVVKEQVADLERRITSLEELQREDHDEFSENATKHDVMLEVLSEQNKTILRRLDQQDTTQEAFQQSVLAKFDEFKKAIFQKLEDQKSKYSDAQWAIAMLLLGGFVSGFIFAILYMIK